MWQYALWSLIGAAVDRGVLFLEVIQRVKGWPWARPKGSGGGVYAVSIIMHLGIAVATTAALATTAIHASGSASGSDRPGKGGDGRGCRNEHTRP